MISEYFEYITGEKFCSKVTDGTHDTPKQVKNGKHLITSKHIKGDEIDFDSAYLISESDFNAINKRSKVDQWDVIISMIGAYCGFCFLESNSEIDYAVKNVGLFKNRSEINAKWLYYYLNSPIGEAHLDAARSGSTQPYISLGSLRELPILVPKDESRKKSIVDVLEVFDSKLRINNNINTELESMAKTLYDYWFVQFDFPDANGKPYKSSSGKMVYNEVLKREIPEGWKQSTLWDIANYYNGLAMQKYRSTGDDYLPVIKIREMNNGISPDTEKARTDIPKAAIIDDGDLLFSWSATLDVKIWSQGKGALNQHIFKVTSDIYPQSFYYFELMNYLSHFKMMADLRKTTMGHITLEHLKQANIVLPPIELIERLDEKLKPIFEHNLILKKENNRLVDLRDWLLPMLMNGQVKVSQ